MIAVCANPKCLKIIRRPPSRILNIAYCNLDCRRAVICRVCPFSADQLREMHWSQEMGLKEIAALASEEMDTATTVRTVRRWMTEAGIKIRTRKEYAQILVARGEGGTHIAKAREVLAEMRANGFVTTNGRHMHTKPVRDKLTQINKALGAAKHETRQCENPACGKDVTRIPSQFQQRVYCSISCASKVNSAKQSRVRESSPSKGRFLPDTI